MAINRFPYQDDILRILRSRGTVSVDDISHAVAGEGRHEAEGHDSAQLHESIAENVDHLVHLGLAEYVGGDGARSAKLTSRGEEAADSLP
jgi:hypothetical protein